MENRNGNDTLFAPQPDLCLIHRMIVVDVLPLNDKKSLILKSNDLTPYHYKCTLRGQWTKSIIFDNNIVNVCSSEWTEDDGFIITDSKGFIVINPDNLVTCTTVAGSLYCPRKTWLSSKFQCWGIGNKIMLIGTLVHELLQTCLTEKIYQQEAIRKKAKEMSTGLLSEAYFNDMTEKELENSVIEYVPWIYEFIEKYLVKGPSPLHETPDEKMKILKVHDIEDNIWCRYYGVKGKVDLTVEVEIHHLKKGRNGSSQPEKTILPLELKTGKASFSVEHAAQAALYTLMMNDRQFGSCDSSLLLYVKDGPKIKRLSHLPNAINSLIQKRNEIAHFLSKWNDGPDVMSSRRMCSKCEYLLPCSLMATNFEEEKLFESDIQSELSEDAMSHITTEDISFFGKWVKILNERMKNGEPNTNQSSSQVFWTQSSQYREESGLCLSNVVIKHKKKFTYTFQKKESSLSSHLSESPVIRTSENLTNWNVRDRVAISLNDVDTSSSQDSQSSSSSHQRDMIAIVTGFIESISRDSITITFDKTIHPSLEKEVFRIDLLGRSSSSFLLNFNALWRLMAGKELDPYGISKKLRLSVVAKNCTTSESSLSKKVRDILSILKDKELSSAIHSALTADHYILIADPSPDSSQTEMFLTTFFKITMMESKQVILTSSNSSKLDDILVDLLEEGISFMKLGNSYRHHEKLINVSEDTITSGAKTTDALERIYKKQMVFAGSIYQIVNHPYFELKDTPFDYCIVLEDEKSLLTTTLAPLLRSKKFLIIRQYQPDKPSENPTFPSGQGDALDKDLSLFTYLKNSDNVVRI